MKDSAAECVPVLCQIVRGTQQHGSVTVMAAGVHLARDDRAMVAPGHFLDVQCIQIRAQADGTLAGQVPLQRCDHAGFGDPFSDVQAPFAQAVGDQGGSAGFLESNLGVTVDIPPDFDQFRFINSKLGNQVVWWHG